MPVYLGIFFLLSFLGLTQSDRVARWTLLVLTLPMLWFMGTRYYVGCDFRSYLLRFLGLSTEGGLGLAALQNEGGFTALQVAVRGLGLEFMWLNIAASALFLVGAVCFCNANRRPMVVFALLFPVIVLQLAMSGLRQGVATGFLMLAAVAYVKNSRLLTALAILVAGTFHASAWIFLPLVFLVGKRVTWKRLIVGLLVLAPAAVLLLESRLAVYGDRYIDQVYGELSSDGAYIRYVLVFLPAILFFFNRDRLRELCPDWYELMRVFSALILLMLPIGLVSSVVLHRLIYYVMPFSALILVYLSLMRARLRKIYLALPFVLYGGYMLAWFSLSSHAAICYVPYRSYLFL